MLVTYVTFLFRIILYVHKIIGIVGVDFGITGQLSDHSAVDISLTKKNRIGQLVRCLELKRGHNAVRREVLNEVWYNILFEFVIFLQIGRSIKMR
jgi:hypothetical protein